MHSTTISPANYHHKTPGFSKTPLKNARKIAKIAAPDHEYFFFKILKTDPARTPWSKTSPGVRSKQYEPLFCRRKPNNGDVPNRSAVEPVPGPRQARPPAKSPRGSARFHSHALSKRHTDRADLAILRKQASR